MKNLRQKSKSFVKLKQISGLTSRTSCNGGRWMSRDDIIQRRRSRHFVLKTVFFREIKLFFRFFRENAEVFREVCLFWRRGLSRKNETKLSRARVQFCKILAKFCKFSKNFSIWIRKISKLTIITFYSFVGAKCVAFWKKMCKDLP